ncbi:hypothetical protein FRX31_013344, partial [Thalictrum thalictroides]
MSLLKYFYKENLSSNPRTPNIQRDDSSEVQATAKRSHEEDINCVIEEQPIPKRSKEKDNSCNVPSTSNQTFYDADLSNLVADP